MIKYMPVASCFLLLFILPACESSETANNSIVENPLTENIVEDISEVVPISEPVQNPSSFVPEGYLIFDKISGDLNNDGRIDSVFIIKKINAENIVVNEYDEIVDRNRRGLMIFFDTKDSWNLVLENKSCFSSENEDGGVYFPPELSIQIEKGKLFIHYSHGRYGYWKYNFRFKKNDFQLIGYDYSNNFGPIIESETSINYLTKKKLFRENMNENTEESGEEVFEETWSDIQIDQLIKLSEIEDFDGLVIE